MPIPKTFHQLWKDARILRKWRASHVANKRIYPDWEHLWVSHWCRHLEGKRHLAVLEAETGVSPKNFAK